MNEMTPQLSDHRQQAMSYLQGLPEGDGCWLMDQRQAALSRFTELGFPDSRQEAWRYSSVEGLLQQGFVVLDADRDIAEHKIQSEFLTEPVAGRLVFVDGLLQPELSDAVSLPGVRLTGLRGAMAAADRPMLEALGFLSGSGDHAFSALNLATMQDGALIRLAANTELERPIELLHVATGAAEGRSLRPRHLIMLEEGASATLVERYISLDECGYFNNLVCEIVLAERARLRHLRVQQESRKAYHLSELYIALQADAHYEGANAATGGMWTRSKINNRFIAAGASCELDGIYLAGNGQLTDFHLDVDHAVPGCISRENFKGIINGKGRAVFDGRILVAQDAQQTDAQLSNDNLMLSRSAEVDTKPQLEIFADDVKCSHGTTVGEIDSNMLFYLQSRGIPRGQAVQMLCQGFAEDYQLRPAAGDRCVIDLVFAHVGTGQAALAFAAREAREEAYSPVVGW